MKPIVFETTFGQYTSIKPLGEGGSGKVYLVQDENGEQYALKLLDSGSATTQKRKRFSNEIAFCRRTEHPSVVRVVDNGIYRAKDGDKPSPFYIMPVYHGSLRSLLSIGLSAEKVLPYFAQILDGVEAAHKMRVTHRDLKPENVLYDEHNDRLIVADFGIAHFEEENLYTLVETRPNERLANFQYAAPEQRLRGRPVAAQADIYALGLILNEMFTHEIPSGTNYRTISSVAPDYSYLDNMVAGMLRQDPSERPKSIDEIKQQLIGRRNDFVRLQQLDRIKQQVIPVSELDDPLIDDPPRLIDWTYDGTVLTLILSHTVNETWIRSLHFSHRQSLMGYGPERFSFSGDKASIPVSDDLIQDIIDYFKGWMPAANEQYEQTIRREKKQAEEAQRAQLRREVEKQERMLRLKQSIKI